MARMRKRAPAPMDRGRSTPTAKRVGEKGKKFMKVGANKSRFKKAPKRKK